MMKNNILHFKDRNIIWLYAFILKYQVKIFYFLFINSSIIRNIHFSHCKTLFLNIKFFKRDRDIFSEMKSLCSIAQCLCGSRQCFKILIGYLLTILIIPQIKFGPNIFHTHIDIYTHAHKCRHLYVYPCMITHYTPLHVEHIHIQPGLITYV